MSAIKKFRTRAGKVGSLLCVGLDSEFSKLPARFKKLKTPQFSFNKWIIDQTHQYVSAYKLNIAFYEARGDQGIRELKQTIDYLRKKHPDIFTICDCKRADIGTTNQGYTESLFDWFGFDAVTLHPYLGQEALQPFLDRKDKACIILCRTSNPGAREFQDLKVSGKPLWYWVAQRVSKTWNRNRNCMLVVGATYPAEIKAIRRITGDMVFLVPGIGVQGGDLEAVLKGGLDAHGGGLIINSSRGIIFGADPAKEAKQLRNKMNNLRSVYGSPH